MPQVKGLKELEAAGQAAKHQDMAEPLILFSIVWGFCHFRPFV